jgi:hypothetical protein
MAKILSCLSKSSTGQPFKLIFYFLYIIRNILYPLVDGHTEKKLANVQEAMYPRKILTVTSVYGASCIFYTDDSLIEGFAGFAVHQMGVGGLGHKILSPAGVFTAELSALFTALRWPLKRCLILTDSLSSIKVMLSRKIAHQTHPLVYEYKQ